MPRPKKKKGRKQALISGWGAAEDDLAPIPDDPNDPSAQGGETWQDVENAWPNGGDANPQGGRWPGGDQQDVEGEAWGTGQPEHPHPPHSWSPSIASPIISPQPLRPSTLANKPDWIDDGKRDERTDDGYSQTGQRVDRPVVEADSEARDTEPHPHPPQSWSPPTTTPVNTPPPPGPSAFASWARNPPRTDDWKRDERTDGGYSQGGQRGDQPGAEADTGQQSWGLLTTTPIYTPPPPGPSAFASWARNPPRTDDGKRDDRMVNGYTQAGQRGDQPGVGSETDSEASDTGQHSLPPQSWSPPTTSPPATAPPPGSSALVLWGRNPQDAPSPASAARPPPTTLSPRPRQDSGSAASAFGWQNWGAEARAIANNQKFVPLAPGPQGAGGGYGQQGRDTVTVASQDPYYAPLEDSDRADATLEAHMIYDSIMGSCRVGATRELRRRRGRGSAQNSTHTAQGKSAPNDWAQENPGWQEYTTHPCPNPIPSLNARSLVYVTCSLGLVFLSWGLSIV